MPRFSLPSNALRKGGMTLQTVFNRLEKKYILRGGQVSALEAVLFSRLQPDSYGPSTVCSLYYDTPDRLLIRRSLEKPVYKEKLRLRSYGVPDSGSRVFIELKKKYKGVVYKRRIGMTCAEAMRYIETGERSCEKTQILSEIDRFRSFYELTPAAFVACDRVALVGRDEAGDSGLRITLDKRIRCRSDDLTLTAGDHGRLILPPEDCLMEIKALGGMPLWLCSALSEHGIFPASFSKYGTFYALSVSGALAQTPFFSSAL